MAGTTSDTPMPAPEPTTVTVTEPAAAPAPDAPHTEPPLEVPAPIAPIVDGPHAADPVTVTEPAPAAPDDPGFHVEPGASAPSDPDGLLTTGTRQTEVRDALDAPRTDVPEVDVIVVPERDARDDPGVVLEPTPAAGTAPVGGQMDRIEEKLDRIVSLLDGPGELAAPAPVDEKPARSDTRRTTDPTPAI